MKELIKTGEPGLDPTFKVPSGGHHALMIEGTLGGATVKLNIRFHRSDWIEVLSETTLGLKQLGRLPPGTMVQATQSGGTSEDLTISFGSVDY